MRKKDVSRHRRSGATLLWVFGVLWVCLSATGCHRRTVQPVLLPQQTPVALDPVKSSEKPPLLETPKTKLPPVPVAEAASKPKPKKRKSKPAPVAVAPAPVETITPTQVADAGVAAEIAAIGDLTPGGEQSPTMQGEATTLIASNEKRLAALGADRLKSQRSLVSKVRNFQKQAQQALRSGDLEGAKTLATKAKLLLDDLERDEGGD